MDQNAASGLQQAKSPAKEPVRQDNGTGIREIIASTIWSLCMKMNLPGEEAIKYVNKIKGKMGYLFENMEKVDIQAICRKAKN